MKKDVKAYREEYHRILIDKFIKPYLPMYSINKIDICDTFEEKYMTIHYMYEKNGEIYAIERRKGNDNNIETKIKDYSTDVLEQIAVDYMAYKPMKYIYATFTFNGEKMAVKCERIENCQEVICDMNALASAKNIRVNKCGKIGKDFKVISYENYVDIFN